MDSIKLLLIFSSLQGRIHGNQGEPYCTNQRGFIPVEEGGSVTIPCSFSYPREKWGTDTKVKFYWRSGKSSPCGDSTNAYIYRHTENLVDERYTGRISMEKPAGQNTASITIRGLKRTDGPMFCCRVELEGTAKEGWYNRPGTYLRFSATDQTYVDQLDIVPAHLGETVIIPCYFNASAEVKRSIRDVIWLVGKDELCRDNKEKYRWTSNTNVQSIGRFSLVDFPNNVSLEITGVTTDDENWYCCQVTTRSSSYMSAYSTELVIVNKAESNSKFIVKQDAVSSADMGDSVTINCSFTISDGTDPLWTGVYWRVGSPTGDYAYHPSREMIHPTYRGRTNLTGQTDLHIQNVQETDNTTYYCLVILRVCVGLNKVNTDIVQGRGTSLNETGNPRITEIILYVAVLLIVIILCGILIFLYMRGILCKRRSAKDDTTEFTTNPTNNNTKSEAVYEIATHEPSAKPDAGAVLYAQLNMPSLNNGKRKRNKENQPESDPPVLYAAIRTAQP